MTKTKLNTWRPGDGETVQFDHSIKTFVVSVRSMTNVGPDTIKDLIQKKFEVVSCEETDLQTIVTPLGYYEEEVKLLPSSTVYEDPQFWEEQGKRITGPTRVSATKSARWKEIAKLQPKRILQRRSFRNVTN